MPLALALREVRLSAVQEQAASYTKKTTRSKLYFLSSLGFFPPLKKKNRKVLSLSLSVCVRERETKVLSLSGICSKLNVWFNGFMLPS